MLFILKTKSDEMSFVQLYVESGSGYIDGNITIFFPCLCTSYSSEIGSCIALFRTYACILPSQQVPTRLSL